MGQCTVDRQISKYLVNATLSVHDNNDHYAHGYIAYLDTVSVAYTKYLPTNQEWMAKFLRYEN